jgi:hypothetical protein
MGVVVHEFEVDVVGQEAASQANVPVVSEDKTKLGAHQLTQIVTRLNERMERIRAH